jgi:hypothetical protein
MASRLNLPVSAGVVVWTVVSIISFYVLKFFYRLYVVRTAVRNIAHKHGIVCVSRLFYLCFTSLMSMSSETNQAGSPFFHTRSC